MNTEGSGVWVPGYINLCEVGTDKTEEAVLTIYEDSDMFVCQTNKGSIWKK